VSDNGDGSWRLAITNPALQTASVGDVIQRVTFDSERALDDPDLTLLDVGHPLVRRLIEEVKQSAFKVDSKLAEGPSTSILSPSNSILSPSKDERVEGHSSSILSLSKDERVEGHSSSILSLSKDERVEGHSSSILSLSKDERVEGHPELVEGYGRTAYIVTPHVQEVTALFHLLARYVVNTDPTSIIEELLPVAVPVYGDELLDPQATRRLLGAKPVPQTRTAAEVQESLKEALSIAGLEELLGAAVETRRQALIAERGTMREQMQARQGAQMAEWLQGIDDLSPGSFDMLTVTVYCPA
jgi:hypothetical protein